MCDIRFLMIEAMPRLRLHAFEHRAAVDAGIDDDQVVQIGGPPVLGVGQALCSTFSNSRAPRCG